MLIYKIKQGEFYIGDVLLAKGLYSGDFEHQNDPAFCGLISQGPIPPGAYWIGKLIEHTDSHGPDFIPLIPVTPGNKLYGRGGFGIHGERLAPPPGHASNGCIIMEHPDRLKISEDHTGELLAVISGNV